MADNIQVSITADATQLRSQLAIAQADVRAYGAEVRTTANAIRTAGDDSKASLLASLDSASAKYNAAQAAATGFRAALNDGGAAVEGATLRMHALEHGLLHVGKEALSGEFSRIPYALANMSLRSHGAEVAVGLIGGAFTSAGIAAIAAVGTIVGGLGLIVYHAQRAQAAITQVQLRARLLGQDGAIAGQQASEMVRQLQGIGVAPKDAEKLAVAFQSMTKATQAQKNALADLAPFMAKSLGVEPEKMAEELARAFDKGASGVDELMKKYNLWDQQAGLTQRTALKQAEDLKDENAAIGVGVDALTRRYQENMDRVAKYRAATAQAPTIFGQPLLPGLYQSRAGFTRSPVAEQEHMAQPPQRAEDPATAQARTLLAGETSDTEKLTAEKEKLSIAERQVGLEVTQAGRDAAQAHAEELRQTVELHQQQADNKWAAAQSEALDQIKTRIEANGTNAKQVAKDTSEAEFKFWTDRAKQAGLSLGQIQAAEKKAAEAHLALLREQASGGASAGRLELQAQLATLSEEQAANRDDFNKVLALEDQKLALLKAAGSRYTAQYETELAKRDAMVRQNATKEIAATEQSIAQQRQLHDQEIAQRREDLEEEVAEHSMSKAQEVTALQAFIAQKHALDLTAMQDFLATLPPQSDAYRKFLNDLTQTQAKWATESRRMNREASTDLERQWDSALAPIGSAFSSSMDGVIQGTQTVQQAVAKMAQSVVLSYLKMGVDSAMHWAASQLRMLFTSQTTQAAQTATATAGGVAQTAAVVSSEAAQVGAVAAGESAKSATRTAAKIAGSAAELTTGSASIVNSAYQAAAHTYASVSAIPYVGWVMAPIAAAGAFAAVMAFNTLTSLDTGAWNLPRDMTANLHAGEMVVPASFAAGIRGALSGRGGDGGSMTLNYAPNVSGGGQDIAALLRGQAAEFKSYLWHATRNGRLAMPGR